MEQQPEQNRELTKQLSGNIILEKQFIKSKARRIATAFAGSVIAVIVIVTIFSDALGLAKVLFSNF